MSIYAPQTPEARRRRARAGRALATAVLIAAAAVAGPQAFASDVPGEATPVETYAVAPGETLWDLAASRTAPGEDVRDTVIAIQHLNAMESTSLQAGQQIYLPLD